MLPALRAAAAPMDVLVRARREAYEAGFEELKQELLEVTKILCSDPPSSR